jgi:hypothetical protein
MNVTDLRSTLEQHAEFHDDGLVGRSSRVHHRVRVVRRRRRAAAAGGLAAAVAVVAAGVALPRMGDEAPAERQFAGVTAPATMEALGYTYSFDRMLIGDGEVRLPAGEPGDEPVLVSWANAADGPMQVTDPSALEAPRWFSSDEDFGDHVSGHPLPDDVVVRGEGEVALAVYTLTDRAAGVTEGGITFREERAGRRLLAAEIGADGQTELRVDFAMPEGGLVAVNFCFGAPEGYRVRTSLAGDGFVGNGCNDVGPHFDASYGEIGYTGGVVRADGSEVRPGERVTARIWIAREHGPEGAERTRYVPGARLGIAFYEAAPPAARVVGMDVPELQEHGGHVYRYVGTVRGPSLTREVSGRPVLVHVAGADGDANGSRHLVVDGRRGIGFSAGGDPFGTVVGPFHEGEHTVELASPGGADGDRTGFSVYERVD